jgi:hypothetical protein
MIYNTLPSMRKIIRQYIQQVKGCQQSARAKEAGKKGPKGDKERPGLESGTPKAAMGKPALKAGF